VSLKQQINDDLKAALLSGNRLGTEVLRGLKATILDEEVARGKREEGLADEEIERLIAREIKKRKESAKVYVGAGRQELADKEDQEVEAMSGYLPKQVSKEDIAKVVDEVVLETSATGMSAMGQVIGAVKSRLGNSADGALVAQIVKDKLQ